MCAPQWTLVSSSRGSLVSDTKVAPKCLMCLSFDLFVCFTSSNLQRDKGAQRRTLTASADIFMPAVVQEESQRIHGVHSIL